MSNVTKSSEDIRNEILTSVTLWFLVFGFAATVHHEDFKKSIRSKGILVGLGVQFFLMPLIGFAFVNFFEGLEDFVLVMIMIITSSPGGAYSNLYNALFNGDLSLSVAMTTVSTLCSLFMLPLNLILYLGTLSAVSGDVELDWPALGRTAGVIVTGVSCGIFANYKTPQYANHYNGVGQLCGAFLILFSLTLSNTGTDEPLWEKDAEIYVITMFPCLVGLLAGVGVSILLKLEKPQVFAIGIEVCLQNSSIAIAVAFAMYSGEEAKQAVAIPVLYGIGNFIVATIFAFIAWKINWTYGDPHGNLFKVLLYNHQPSVANRKKISEKDSKGTEPESAESDKTGNVGHYVQNDLI
mmetsp:Transcript_1399/g.1630  ORF Transcript_1399/g.1630 Transcript_1399/m.1630 type:complete len:352 (+) Transcript_1399:225-1280(+)